MTDKFTRAKLADMDARIVAPEEIVREHTTVVRHFDLPVGLHVATVGLYFAILGVFAMVFGEREMIIPFAIFAIFVVGGFGVPALWARMQPDHADRAMTWAAFERLGIDTHTGVLKAKDATVQVLMLPVFILAWAVAIAIIAATV